MTDENGQNDWPALSGALNEGSHRLPVRIYFEDTDFSGVVYHARYLHFFERGRSDFLRLSGVHHHAMENGVFGDPLYFVVRGMSLNFRAPARIDDVVVVETNIKRATGARLVMDQTISKAEQILVNAEVTVALIGGDGSVKRLPETLKEMLNVQA